MTTGTATAVSRTLRANGITTRPSHQATSREGIYVRSSLGQSAWITVAIDTPSEQAAAFSAIWEVLAAAGYLLQRHPTSDAILYASKVEVTA